MIFINTYMNTTCSKCHTKNKYVENNGKQKLFITEFLCEKCGHWNKNKLNRRKGFKEYKNKCQI